MLLLFFNPLKDPGQYFLKIIEVFTARVGYRIKFTCFLFFGNTLEIENLKKKKEKKIMVNNHRLNAWDQNMSVSWKLGATLVLQGNGFN